MNSFLEAHMACFHPRGVAGSLLAGAGAAADDGNVVLAPTFR
ncbi:hypothetical protein [Kitasatospora sp. SUK 42]|nr:hypothetical protein [Kitasatospora sp. SUK 42]